MSQLKVWIDQDLCTGDGICVELQPGDLRAPRGRPRLRQGASWADIYNGAGGEPAYKMADGVATVPKSQVDSHDRSRRGVPRRVHLPGDHRVVVGW